MNAGYKPVSWNRTKIVYDIVVLAGIIVYVLGYIRLGPSFQDVTLPLDDWTIAMKAYGSCAFILLTLILCIGPLARLDHRFLPLLYNRRHFGVLTCAVALSHVSAVLSWYFAFSSVPSTEAVLAADTSFGQLQGFPFIPFGIFALFVLLALASTSHDFWLRFLSPPIWKGLHMMIYAAYASVIAHVAMGVLQDDKNPLFPTVVVLSIVAVCGLHVVAGRREHAREIGFAASSDEAPWIEAASVDAIAEGHGAVIHLSDGEPVAIFRHQGRLSAVSNICAHQNGPLGEGRIIDGCITCPWHAFQYRVEDGCSPPPFTERIATYHLRLDGRRVLLDPRPNPLGTRVEPIVIGEQLT
jgi:nitrite reductase/ring-hydroxylating ferredoxin subunit/DMSO/TMAO reductase YedYZ heme-binding membrane subunit